MIHKLTLEFTRVKGYFLPVFYFCRLIVIDFINLKITEINRNNSSWNVWKGKDLENGKYSIEISPTESIEFQT